MATKNESRKTIDQVFILLGCASTVAFLFIGILAWTGYRFADNSVHDELASQKVFFPVAGDASFTPAEYPTLQQYAGQQVDNGPKAKAYADDYIGHHLTKIAGGKTYSEVSALAMKDPTNTTLQTQKATLFQGEMLRGMLLGDGYAYWTFGQLAMYASIGSFIAAAIMAVLVFFGMAHKAKM